jgi:DNA polymerase-3 subunit gamma/tau
VGKTTIARILAKCLNCETGVSSTPCGQCSVCREIDEGRFVDLIEVDAASRTKVEDTRELLENVQYAPTRGRYKVYLIDEVHMLSTHSFNALLKTLEEPPPHVKFLLATTDPQKLPVTILSRCLQFSLKNMPPERVVEHLTHVLTAENVPFEPDALWLLGRAADGSMRDAMSLTDQAIAFGEGKVLAADVRSMLGTLDHGQVYGVLHALLDGDARALMEAVRHLAEQGPDWNGVLAEMLNVLHRVAIAQVLPDAVDNGQGDRERVLELAGALPAEDVQFYYQMGLIGRRDLPLAPDPRSGFEMVLLRMLAFRPADAEGGPRPPLKSTGISPATADPGTASVAGAAPVAAAPVAAPPARHEPVAAPAPAPAPAPRSAVAAPAPVTAEPPVAPAARERIDLPWEESPAPVASEPVPEPVAEPKAPAPELAAEADDSLEDDEPPPPADDYYDSLASYDYVEPADAPTPAEPELPAAQPATGLAAEWLDIYPRLGLAGLTASIAANCSLMAAGDVWRLHLEPTQSALYNAAQHRRMNEALNQYLGRSVQLEVEIVRPEQETPAQAAARWRAERQQQAEQSIHDDPLVREMIQQFGATIRPDSIEPLNT